MRSAWWLLSCIALPCLVIVSLLANLVFPLGCVVSQGQAPMVTATGDGEGVGNCTNCVCICVCPIHREVISTVGMIISTVVCASAVLGLLPVWGGGDLPDHRTWLKLP